MRSGPKPSMTSGSVRCGDAGRTSRQRASREPASFMDAHLRDAQVFGFEELVPTIRLPDPNDRHVVAAAIRGEADIILTANLRDFPARALAPHGLIAEHPDNFLAGICRASQHRFLEALGRVRIRLRNPPVSRERHLDALRRAGLNATATEIVSGTA